MKRYPLVIATTAAGLGVVLGFHPATSSVGIALPANSSKVSGSSQTKNTPPPTTTVTTPTTATKPNNSPTTSAAPTTTATSPNPSSNAVKSAVGQTENYGYGQLSVKATVSGNKITSITLAQLQVAESYSQSIASQVIPQLKSEVLQAQSLRVNGFTGATYTTEAYLYSLQSALHKLHFK